MIYNHYRRIVRPKEAARYWQINPPEKPKRRADAA
jgi:hypothetical protein